MDKTKSQGQTMPIPVPLRPTSGASSWMTDTDARQKQQKFGTESKVDKPKTVPNTVHPEGQEYWNPTPEEVAACTYQKPPSVKLQCYYCGCGGHGTTGCGTRREDLALGFDQPYHPQ